MASLRFEVHRFKELFSSLKVATTHGASALPADYLPDMCHTLRVSHSVVNPSQYDVTFELEHGHGRPTPKTWAQIMARVPALTLGGRKASTERLSRHQIRTVWRGQHNGINRVSLHFSIPANAMQDVLSAFGRVHGISESKVKLGRRKRLEITARYRGPNEMLDPSWSDRCAADFKKYQAWLKGQ